MANIREVPCSRPSAADLGALLREARAAQILGIPVAATTLRRFGEQTALISQRFDRRVDADG